MNNEKDDDGCPVPPLVVVFFCWCVVTAHEEPATHHPADEAPSRAQRWQGADHSVRSLAAESADTKAKPKLSMKNLNCRCPKPPL